MQALYKICIKYNNCVDVPYFPEGSDQSADPADIVEDIEESSELFEVRMKNVMHAIALMICRAFFLTTSGHSYKGHQL